VYYVHATSTSEERNAKKQKERNACVEWGRWGACQPSLRETRALSERGEARADPPSGTRKKNINNEAYVIRLHRIPTLGKELEA